MVTVVETHSVSWAESVRLALVGAGIEAIVLDPYSAGSLGLAGSIRVAILEDADLQRARTILAELRPPRTADLASWWWHKRALIVLSVAFVLTYLGTQMADDSSQRIQLALLGACAIAYGAALVLLILGYRADKRQASLTRPQDDRENATQSHR